MSFIIIIIFNFIFLEGTLYLGVCGIIIKILVLLLNKQNKYY